jgi:hypothetical protein
MDNYLIKGRVTKTEVYEYNFNLFRIEVNYQLHGDTPRSTSYLMPKTLTPPIVGQEIEIRIGNG